MGRMMRTRGTPAAFIERSSRFSPIFPKVMSEASKTASGSDVGTKLTLTYHMNLPSTVAVSPLPTKSSTYRHMNCMTNTNRQMKKAPTKSCRNLPKIKVSSRLSLYMIDMHSKCEAKIQFSFHSQAVCGGESRRRRTVCENTTALPAEGRKSGTKTPSACKNCPTSARRRTKNRIFVANRLGVASFSFTAPLFLPMHSLPPLISDLALILIVAGLVTVLFKRLKQPLVLGYIVAGFLAGPHMPYLPTVEDQSSIETWSSIGVIFLMFSLGLEFSIKKILKWAMRPVVAAAMVMGCMIGVGGATGRLFDWSSTDSLFLGGMLAMSFHHHYLQSLRRPRSAQQNFAGEVLSVLILEDILGILLMVILSATAVSQQFQGGELARSLISLGFFLVLWFVVGIYVVPAFLRRARNLINNETLVVVALGLCFLLVVLADRAGYSSAFGAFMMGSILAETLEAEKIEKLTAPIKDLFGAIFFVSVGMMVNPGILVEHWGAVLVITLAVLGGQAVFGTLSFVVAGHPLRRAMNCGFSLAQIGEFASSSPPSVSRST